MAFPSRSEDQKGNEFKNLEPPGNAGFVKTDSCGHKDKSTKKGISLEDKYRHWPSIPDSSILDITEEDKRILLDSWFYLRRDQITNGTLIMFKYAILGPFLHLHHISSNRYFEDYPEIKDIYYKDVEMEALPFNGTFIEGVKEKMHLLEKLLNRLHCPPACIRIANAFGYRMVKRKIPPKSYKNICKSVGRAMVKIFEHRMFELEDLEQVWYKFLCIITAIMASPWSAFRGTEVGKYDIRPFLR